MVIDKLTYALIVEDKWEKYNELILAVETKYPNESRHETALRYIREAENKDNNVACKKESLVSKIKYALVRIKR